MKHTFIFLLLLVVNSYTRSQELGGVDTLVVERDTAILYNQQGEEVAVDQLYVALEGKTHIFFGELHGKSLAHHLELDLLKRLQQMHGHNVVLGMEMFESDVQLIIDEYFNGWITKRHFEADARIWNNYADYRPIVEFAKEHGIRLVATNIPRRYANAVYNFGESILDSFTPTAKSYFVKTPISIDTTLQIYSMIKTMGINHNGENLLLSQALKDATMAKYIKENIVGNKVLLHLNGAFHSKFREGIISYLSNVPKKRILTVCTIFRSEMEERGGELEGIADFIWVLDE